MGWGGVLEHVTSPTQSPPSSVGEQCQPNYSVCQYVTINEMLVRFQEDISFRVYIPSKPMKYGIKIFILTDANLHYCLNAKFTTQNEPYLCRENLKNNKPELLEAFVNLKGRGVSSCMHGFSGKITLVSFVPKKGKVVNLISAMHHSQETDESTGKPVIIMDYNQTDRGVDALDKKYHKHSTGRRTRRWWWRVSPSIAVYCWTSGSRRARDRLASGLVRSRWMARDGALAVRLPWWFVCCRRRSRPLARRGRASIRGFLPSRRPWQRVPIHPVAADTIRVPPRSFLVAGIMMLIHMVAEPTSVNRSEHCILIPSFRYVDAGITMARHTLLNSQPISVESCIYHSVTSIVKYRPPHKLLHKGQLRFVHSQWMSTQWMTILLQHNLYSIVTRNDDC
ncbi:hypothetical protein PR048_005686 [Dryococelus australis]|uniref:PiggyBac transposable element-derived protein domain-containing protein n=1 Tax=Dryococelus australis TaxID=614101 RepID=A0ABQ9I8X2_9NEOP|nr:hypothetical protein PR048_005686 [Dryococelus australis]